MKIMVSKDEWQGCPIGGLQFDLASGKGYLLWGDEIKNVWLEASFSNPIFFKQSQLSGRLGNSVRFFSVYL